MGRKEITTKEDLMKVIELFENTGITYWLDGGWGVDILAGKQTRIEQNRCAMACQGCDAVFLFLNKKAVETKS